MLWIIRSHFIVSNHSSEEKSPDSMKTIFLTITLVPFIAIMMCVAIVMLPLGIAIMMARLMLQKEEYINMEDAGGLIF
jgi:hypothetical protein